MGLTASLFLTPLFSNVHSKGCGSLIGNYDLNRVVINNNNNNNQWHYSPDGRKPPLIQFHSLC
jgi:hypothetical protein